jgi:hypothetical protein
MRPTGTLPWFGMPRLLALSQQVLDLMALIASLVAAGGLGEGLGEGLGGVVGMKYRSCNFFFDFSAS